MHLFTDAAAKRIAIRSRKNIAHPNALTASVKTDVRAGAADGGQVLEDANSMPFMREAFERCERRRSYED
jgi:hypothetical protein